MALLLGPPELCDFTCTASETPNKKLLRRGLVVGGTDNFYQRFSSTGDSCLDFLFHVEPDTQPELVMRLLENAWRQNPLTALKLVCRLRGLRGTGESQREEFYTAACWIHSHHPKTLLANLPVFAQFGYLKDLPEILLRILQGHQQTIIKRWSNMNSLASETLARMRRMGLAKPKSKRRHTKQGSPGYFSRKGAAAREAKKSGTLRPREQRIEEDLGKGKQKSAEARVARRQKLMEDASTAVKRFSEDPNYRALHDEIAQHFANLLAKDLEVLNSGKVGEISLAAKWCPSLNSSYDLTTLLCENIARRLFPREDYPDVADERHYVYRVRDRLRKKVLAPLRKALQIPEVYISTNLWKELPYNKVASVAMKNYKKLFLKHDPDGFAQFCADQKSQKNKIAGEALLPHEIIEQALESEGKDDVSELHWSRLVADVTREGKLSDSLAVCDVSSSMRGLPLQVCIALGLLVSEMSSPPWKGHVISLCANPKLRLVEGDTVADKYRFTQNLEGSRKTNFQKVFDAILNVACECKLQPEKMRKELFVFSDMGFNQVSLNPWETDWRVIERKYREAGYGAPPKLFFWDLRNWYEPPRVH